jgi:hypothetical protein
MSETKYACPQEGCTREFYTQVGLDVHIKTHLPVPTETPETLEVEKEVPKTQAKKKMTSDDEVATLNNNKMTLQQSKDLWKKRTKKMRKTITVKVGEKLTKKNFCKMLETNNWHAGGKSGEVVAYSNKDFTDASYIVKDIRKMRNDWKSFQALGNKGQKVSWREGPIYGRHHITIPEFE